MSYNNVGVENEIRLTMKKNCRHLFELIGSVLWKYT